MEETFSGSVLRYLLALGLTPLELDKIKGNLEIYTEIENLLNDTYLSDEIIAKSIAQGILAIKLNAPFLNWTIDVTNPYLSIILIVFIEYLSNPIKMIELDLYQHFYTPQNLTTIKDQKEFLFTLLIPVYMYWGQDREKTLTITDIEVNKAIYNSVNPGLTRYLKEKYAYNYFLKWPELIDNWLDLYSTKETILAKLVEKVSNDEAVKFSPGTDAYKKLIDTNAYKLGQLSKQSYKLTYPEMITLCKMYLSVASLTVLCSIVNAFKDRLDFDDPCETYSIGDIIEVLNILVDSLSKVELEKILYLLGKSSLIPRITSELNGPRINVYPNYLSDVAKLKSELVYPFRDLQKYYYHSNKLVQIKRIIKEVTKKEIRRIEIFPKLDKIFELDKVVPNSSNILTDAKESILLMIEGSMIIRTMNLNKWIVEILINEGDIILFDFSVERLDLSKFIIKCPKLRFLIADISKAKIP
jgi:hypothetical protein